MLQTIFREEPTSRADIARLTGLTRPTVSELVSLLEAEGLIEEVGQGPATRGGKPPTLLALRSTSRQIVTVDASSRPFEGAITDLRGRIIQRTSATELHPEGDAALDSVQRLVDALMAVADGPVLGIGIGTPGVISEAGEVITASNLGWESLDLAGILERRFDIPVQVTNDADAAALAEFSRVRASSGAGLIVVTVGEGIGAGIILDGRPHTGDGFAAGELGHIISVRRGGAPCRCGKRGCLETVTGEYGILRNAGMPASVLDEDLTSHRARQLLAEAAGSPATKQAGTSLGSVLATLVSILDVHRIVIAGDVTAAGDSLLDAVRTEIERRVLSPIAPTIDISFSTLGADIVLLGAAAQVLSSELGVVWR